MRDDGETRRAVGEFRHLSDRRTSYVPVCVPQLRPRLRPPQGLSYSSVKEFLGPSYKNRQCCSKSLPIRAKKP